MEQGRKPPCAYEGIGVATELEPPAPGLKACCKKRSTRQVENTQPLVSDRSKVFATNIRRVGGEE
jgi:hypothetical protein